MYDLQAAVNEYNHTIGLQEILWRQKPRIAWLKGVNLNSNFFHIVTISHRRENRVLTITAEDDGVAETKSEVKDIFVRYFKARWYVNAPMVNGGSPHFKIISLTIRLDISLDLSLETRLWMRLKSYLCTRHQDLMAYQTCSTRLIGICA